MEGLYRDNIRIGITIGDPAGCGPYIIKDALKEFEENNIILYGPKEILESYGDYAIVQVKYGDFPVGKPSTESGRIAYESLVYAIEDALNGKIDAIVTAPVSKESLFMAGYNYSGQTEILKDKTDTDPIMVMGNRSIIEIAFYTRHIPLKDVPNYVKKERLIKFFKQLFVFYDKIKIMGLNPHAGENGNIGREEVDEIIPAIEEMKKNNYNIEGVFAADTVSWREKEKCVWVAMYHDQGAIISKDMCGYKTLNISVGLPFLRVSPGHGTAFDKVSRGSSVDSTSMKEAVKFAFEWAKEYREKYQRGYYE